MNIDEYCLEWSNDAPLNKNDLDIISLNVPVLHAKYMNFLSHERIKYKRLLEKKTLLESTLEDYFLGKIDGPSIGREPHQIIETKASAVKRISTDKEIINLNLNLINQEEIVLFLKEVIQSINNRNFSIKNFIDYRKFVNGS